MAYYLESTKRTTFPVEVRILADRIGFEIGIEGLYSSWSASLPILGDAFRPLQRGAAVG